MRVLAHLLTLVVVVSSCFLNSCPYRRYGRTLRCTSCGANMEGICLGDGTCCTAEQCHKTEECSHVSACPERFCRLPTLNFAPGYCVQKGLCCNTEKCERSAMCL